MVHVLREEDDPPPFRPWRAAGTATLFLAVLFAALALLQPYSPLRYPPMLRDKVEYFERHKDEFDVLILGSSAIYRGIDPVLFDAELARRGHDLRSFNLAQPGMRSHHTDMLLRQVFATKPARLRWVLLDQPGWNWVMRERNHFTGKEIAWHSVDQTLSMSRTILLTDAPARERADRVLLHLKHMALKYLQVGQGVDYIAGLRRRFEEPLPEPDRLALDRGFLPLDRDVEGLGERPREAGRYRQFHQNLGPYYEEIEALRASRSQEGSLEHYNVGAVLRQIELIERFGATPVYVIPPVLEPHLPLYRLAASGEIPRLVAYNDPDADWPLFDPDNRFDRAHVDEQGAKIWTAMLAEDFARLLDEAAGD